MKQTCSIAAGTRTDGRAPRRAVRYASAYDHGRRGAGGGRPVRIFVPFAPGEQHGVAERC